MTQVEAMEGRLTELDIQIREFREQGRVSLNYEDIMRRYAVGRTRALEIIRGIRSVCGGGKLGSGKVLPSEVLYWESLIIKKNVRL